MAASTSKTTSRPGTGTGTGTAAKHNIVTSSDGRGESARTESHDAIHGLPDSPRNPGRMANLPLEQASDGSSVTRTRNAERKTENIRGTEGQQSGGHGNPHAARPNSMASNAFDVPDDYTNLDELADPSPVENPDEAHVYHHRSLEESRSREQAYRKDQEGQRSASQVGGRPEDKKAKDEHNISKLATQLYTISYLILFSFLGTLARLGLQAITFYPGAPIVFSELWANLGGSLVMGFLSEDRMLFREEWGTPTYHQQLQKAEKQKEDDENGSAGNHSVDLQAAKKAHGATKKTIPLYIGLATGFCGCFTSFSSFIRDAFLALSNDLPSPLNHPADYRLGSSTASTVSRNGGYSFMALLSVVIVTVAVCISGLHIGAHLAVATESFTPTFPFKFCRKVLDPLAVFLAWGCWLGAVFLAIFPPDRHEGPPEIWRGRAVFALVFAPLGCLGRFYASLYLNGKISSFPLGTFVVNMFGTAMIGMSYDLQHVPLGGVVGCQVLQGIEDGFCGCLTTVSTWVSELSSLRRSHAYTYGSASVVVALCFLIVIMGSMQWTRGFSEIVCVK